MDSLGKLQQLITVCKNTHLSVDAEYAVQIAIQELTTFLVTARLSTTKIAVATPDTTSDTASTLDAVGSVNDIYNLKYDFKGIKTSFKECKESHHKRLVNVETRLSALTAANSPTQDTFISSDGCFIWKIDNVSEQKSQTSGTTRYIYSPPFYSKPYGYKLGLRLFFNGDGNGKNTHISLFFVVHKGDYDALLTWPFQNKITMSLINQSGGRDITEKFWSEHSSSFVRPVENVNTASGCPQFAEISVAYGSQYCVDNVMFIKCIVGTM